MRKRPMKLTFQAVLAATIALLMGPAAAQRAAVSEHACSHMPSWIKSLDLVRKQSWKLLKQHDLLTEDRDIWRKVRGNMCPGLLNGVFTSSGKRSWAMALLKSDHRGAMEQLALLTDERKGTVRILDKREIPAGPFVLTIGKPGQYRDTETGRRIRTSHDGIILEKIEVSTTLIYLNQKGVIVKIPLSV
jgi:hypothetical protein